jgi:hypothetical protein
MALGRRLPAARTRWAPYADRLSPFKLVLVDPSSERAKVKEICDPLQFFVKLVEPLSRLGFWESVDVSI